MQVKAASSNARGLIFEDCKYDNGIHVPAPTVLDEVHLSQVHAEMRYLSYLKGETN